MTVAAQKVENIVLQTIKKSQENVFYASISRWPSSSPNTELEKFREVPPRSEVLNEVAG